VSFMTSVLSKPAGGTVAFGDQPTARTFRSAANTFAATSPHHCLYPRGGFRRRRVAAAGGR